MPLCLRALVVPILALAAGGLAACGGGPPPVQGPEPLAPLEPANRIYYDNSGGIADSVRIVIRDPGAYADVWARATERQGDPPPAPEVNFDEEMVLVVGAGRMTPEDQIRVDSIGIREVTDPMGETEEVLAVVVRTLEGCGRFAVDAYPLEIVTVPRFEGPVRFVERIQQDPNCGPQARGSGAAGDPRGSGPGMPAGRNDP
jgi:hypothetical protein